MPFIEHDNQQIYYETAGDEANPSLLIIAGITDSIAKCAWQLDDLAADFHVIAFDNRGAGRSSTPPPGYGMSDVAGDAAAVLAALGVASAHIFGFSMGGMAALHLALRYPHVVRRLVLGCTSAGGRLSVLPEAAAMSALISPDGSGNPRQDFYDRLWISVSDRCIAEQEQVIESLAELAATNPQTPLGYAGQLQAVLAHDVADQLDRIHMPTLVLHGADDRLIPVENGRLLAEAIPGARLILYPEAGHLFFIERAEEVNRDIRAFLRADK
jgi:pimeloyl-ACP methyl ester carboxylesterase